MATLPSPNDLTRQQLDELDALLQRMLSLPLNKPEAPSAAAYSPPPLPEMPPAPQRPSANWRTDPSSSTRTPYFSSSPVAQEGPAAVAFSPSFIPTPPPAAPAATPVVRQSVSAAAPTAQASAASPAAAATAASPESFAAGLTISLTNKRAESPPAGPDYHATGTLRGVDAPATPAGFRSVFAGEAAATDPFPSLPNLFDRQASSVAMPPPDHVKFEVVSAPVPATRSESVPAILWPVWLCNVIIEWMLGWFGPIGAVLTHPTMKTLLGSAGVVMILSAVWWTVKGLGWLTWMR